MLREAISLYIVMYKPLDLLLSLVYATLWLLKVLVAERLLFQAE